MTYTVDLDARKRLVIHTPFVNNVVMKLQALPDRRAWDPRRKAWVATPSRTNIEHLLTTLPELVWTSDAQELARVVLEAAKPPVRADVSDYRGTPQPPPYAHQLEGLARSRDAKAYALLMQQRTGKTRIFIDTANHLFEQGEVDLAFVVCPNGVKTVWAEEQIDEWTPPRIQHEILLYRPGERENISAKMASFKKGMLQWLVVNCDALSHDKSVKWLKSVLAGRRTIVGIDEASRFKHHSSRRSKNLLGMRSLFEYRRILTGTLITQSPLDAYTPFSFLDPAILGYGSYFAMRNEFAILGGWNHKQVVDYVNLDKLANLIEPFSYRVTRDQVRIGMPPNVYSKLEVELNPEQRRIYNQMRDEMIAQLEADVADPDKVVTAAIILTQRLRLAQIAGGFVPDPMNKGKVLAIPGPNPKLEALVDELEEDRGKTIIWARFRAEIALVANRLRDEYGVEAVVEFHGDVSEPDRFKARTRFQDPTSGVRFFVGQTDTGGIGIPLHAADEVYYFSNSFNLESRLQSEDRAEALDRTRPIGFTDIVAKDTVDPKTIEALRTKQNLATIVTKDNFKEWI